MRIGNPASRIRLRWLALAVSSLLLILDTGCLVVAENRAPSIENPASSIENRDGLPPLVVDTSSPLLLDEPGEGQDASANAATRAAAENAGCFVCHANYRGEFLVTRHAGVDIGCSKCHGESLAHKNDENNTTAPEIMYSADQIGPFCRGCHKAPPKNGTPGKEGELDEPDPRRTVCTDCHGEHRMKVRTVLWDKESGRLLRTNTGD